MNRTEYEEEQKTAHAIDYLKREVLPRIPVEVRPFFQIKYCRGSKLPQEPLEALIEAIQIFSSQVTVSKICIIRLSDSDEFRFNARPCGSVIYKQNPEFMATTFIGNNSIFLNLQKLSLLPKGICVAGIIEEFVHSFFDIEGHPLASNIVALLHPKVRWNEERVTYQVVQEDHMPSYLLSHNNQKTEHT